jgi:hypothetical protein
MRNIVFSTISYNNTTVHGYNQILCSKIILIKKILLYSMLRTDMLVHNRYYISLFHRLTRHYSKTPKVSTLWPPTVNTIKYYFDRFTLPGIDLRAIILHSIYIYITAVLITVFAVGRKECCVYIFIICSMLAPHELGQISIIVFLPCFYF